MGNAEFGTEQRSKRSLKRGRRMAGGRGITLDMTPLVDIAFLLLTFFMFATTMAQPTMMELKIPPDIDTPIDVPADDVITLYIADDGALYYTVGMEQAFHPIPQSELQEFAVRRNSERGNRLALSLKVHPNAAHHDLVAVLDQLNGAEGILTEQYRREGTIDRDRKFSIQRLDSAERAGLEGLPKIDRNKRR